MNKNRLEAFSDGVFAIIITIMVLEFKAPENVTMPELLNMWPTLVSYLLSFVYVGIYWNNHHHLFQAVKKINGKILWANHFLLFSLSLVPFTTALLSRSQFNELSTLSYGVVLFLAAFAYYLLTNSLLHQNLLNLGLKQAVGEKRKEKISLGLYFIALPLAGYISWMAMLIFALVAAMWFYPDKRLEVMLSESSSNDNQ